MKFPLVFFVLFNFLSESQSESRGCDEIVITDCDRNFCQIQVEPEWPSADLCQIICQNFEDSLCQSWAYSINNKVRFIIPHYGFLLAYIL